MQAGFTLTSIRNLVGGSGCSYLDSPSTTSATTYKIQGFIGGSTQYVNRSIRDNDAAGYDPRSTSSLTLMEVLV